MPYAYLDSPSPIAFAHRGGTTTGVENAVSAFEHVRRLGYRYVETDVRTTYDGVPVVFHDADTARLTGRTARIRDLTLSQVRGLALASGEPIATLEQVLGALPDLRFNIDLKDEGGVHGVPAVLARTGSYDRVCLTSFAEGRIRRVRRLVGPSVCTGLGVAGVARTGLRALVGAGPRPTGTAAVLQVPWHLGGGRTLPRWFVELGRRQGLAVHVWTLNDRASIGAALDLGVDGVMTDQPALLQDELRRRGLWRY